MTYDHTLPWDKYPCLDWPFGASVSKSGRPEDRYGVVQHGAKQFRVTRLCFEHFNRKLLPGEEALHACNRPIFFQAAHLRAGTQRDNIDDAVSQGRHCHGETHGMAELAEHQITQVTEYIARGLGQTEIAKLFNVSSSLIWRIQHKKVWKHLSDHGNQGV